MSTTNKTHWTKVFNAKFKVLMKRISGKHPNDIDLKAKIDAVNNEIRSLNNRILIHIFSDYIVDNKVISKNIQKDPSPSTIKFWTNFSHDTYKKITGRDDSNVLFNQIKKIFEISDEKEKKYVISTFYTLKNVIKRFNSAFE